jgi:hypothetical protein
MRISIILMPIWNQIWIRINAEIRILVGIKTMPISNIVGADTD